jgi:hypothetical protein
MNRRAFLIIEALLAAIIILMGFLAFLSMYSGSLKHSVQSRDHIMALIQLENLLEEVEDHFYGQPRPEHWKSGTWSPLIVTAGDFVETEFDYRVEVDPEKGNGSFFDATKTDRYDVLKVTVHWYEGTGASSERVEKEVVLSRPVWRDKDAFGHGK